MADYHGHGKYAPGGSLHIDYTAALKWPWIYNLDVESSMHGDQFAMLMHGGAVKLVEKEYNGPHGLHQHYRIRVSPDLPDYIEIDEHELTSVSWEIDKIEVKLMGSGQVGHKSGGPGTVELTGPGVKKIATWAYKLWYQADPYVTGTPPFAPHSIDPGHSHGVFQFHDHPKQYVPLYDAPSNALAHFAGSGVDTVWIDPKTGKTGGVPVGCPTLDLPYFALGDLPWHFQCELPGGGVVKVKVWDAYGVNDNVAIDAYALMPLGANAYAAHGEVAKQAVYADGTLLKKQAQEVVNTALAGAWSAAKSTKKPLPWKEWAKKMSPHEIGPLAPKPSLADMIASNVNTPGEPLTPETLKAGIEALEKQDLAKIAAEVKTLKALGHDAALAEAKKLSAQADEAMASFTTHKTKAGELLFKMIEKHQIAHDKMADAMMAASPKVAAFGTALSDLGGGMMAVKLGYAGTALHLEEVAAKHELAAMVGQAYPSTGHVLLALAKFDGRPAEWEECEMLYAELTDQMPVSAQLKVVPLTPDVADLLTAHKQAQTVKTVDLGDPGPNSKMVVYVADCAESIVGWGHHTFGPVKLGMGDSLKLSVPADEEGDWKFADEGWVPLDGQVITSFDVGFKAAKKEMGMMLGPNGMFVFKGTS